MTTDNSFRYTTRDGETHTLNISVLHMARAERMLDTSVTEWAGRLEPQLRAAFEAWKDISADNGGFFETWCDTVVAVGGKHTVASVHGGKSVPVSLKVLLEAERLFKQSYLGIAHSRLLNFRMFVVWRACLNGGRHIPTLDDFDVWLGSVDEELECDVWVETEEDNDENPKVL